MKHFQGSCWVLWCDAEICRWIAQVTWEWAKKFCNFNLHLEICNSANYIMQGQWDLESTFYFALIRNHEESRVDESKHLQLGIAQTLARCEVRVPRSLFPIFLIYLQVVPPSNTCLHYYPCRNSWYRWIDQQLATKTPIRYNLYSSNDPSYLRTPIVGSIQSSCTGIHAGRPV